MTFGKKQTILTPMIKSKLNSFIGKYNLGGFIEVAKLTTKDKVLSTNILSDDKSVMGIVQLRDFDLEDAEFGINETSKLKSLLGVLNEDITVDFAKVDGDSKSLKFSDKETDINYTLAELEVIPKVPNLKSVPAFELEIPLTKDFVSKFIRAKAALNEVDTFTVAVGPVMLLVELIGTVFACGPKATLIA